MRSDAALVVVGVLASAALAADVPALTQSAAQAYREGRYMDALRDMSVVLEEEPENAVAKNYVWTIARKMAQEDASAVPKPGELEKAERLAVRDLEERRRRADQVLDALRAASRRSDNPRGPSDLLAGVEGLDKQLGPEFEAERADAQARAYLDNILSRLTTALQKRTFVTSKDVFRAQGYLAYYQHDWEKALEWWEKAAKEDPADVRLREDIGSLRNLVSRKREESAIQDLHRQAETYSRTGYPEEAYEAWRAILKRRPDWPGAKEKALAAKIVLEKSRKQAALRDRTNQGVAEFKAGRHLAAAQIWLEVLQEDPSYDQARSWLTLVAKNLKNNSDDPAEPPPAPAGPSHAATAPAPGGDPARAAQLYKKGLMAYAEGRLEEANQLWRRALQADPSLKKAQEALRQGEAELSLTQR